MSPRFAATLRATLLVTLLVTAGCGGSGPTPPNPPPPPPAPPPPPPIGVPAGDPVSADIGPSGGTIAMPDGKFTLQFPAGAVDKTTRITIHPFVSTAPNSIGSEYAVEPTDLALKQPVHVRMTLTDTELGDLAPEGIGLAYRNASGVWEGNLETEVTPPVQPTGMTKADGTGSSAQYDDDLPALPTTTLVTLWKRTPESASVAPGGSVTMQVFACVRTEASTSRAVLSETCTPSTRQGTWYADGTLGGNNFFGHVVTGSPSSKADYHADGIFPPPLLAHIEARLTSQQTGRWKRFLFPITVTGTGGWAGTVTFSYEGDTTYSDGDATVKEVRSGHGTFQLRSRPGHVTQTGALIQAESWNVSAHYERKTTRNVTGTCHGTVTTERSTDGTASGAPVGEDVTAALIVTWDPDGYWLEPQPYPQVETTGTEKTTTRTNCGETSRTDEAVDLEQLTTDVLVLRQFESNDTSHLSGTFPFHDPAATWVKVTYTYNLRKT